MRVAVSERGIARIAPRALIVLAVLAGFAVSATAQQRVPVPPARADTLAADTLVKRPPRRIPNTIPDSLLRPPISPKAAFLHSLLLPGWGQSSLRRTTAATLFSAAEIGAIYMVAKSRADLRQAKSLRGLDSIAVGDPSLGETVTRIPAVTEELINARKLHLEDWLAAWIFNHLLAGADAYVAANLWDLPARVSIQHTPAGPGIGAQFRW